MSMRLRTIATLLTLLLASAAPATTEVYRSENAQGNPVFSDRPEDGGEPVTIEEPNRTPAVQPRPRPEPEDTGNERGSPYSIAISKPADGTFIPNGLVPTEVQVDLSPPLLPKHVIEFLVNGESVSSGASTHHTIPRLTPGAHTLSARILNPEGEELIRATPVRVTTQWPSNNRRRSPSPRP